MSGENVWDMNVHEGGRLAARWWQWAFSAHDECSPVLDETGEFADWQQPEDVWFLAGTYDGRVERRRCGGSGELAAQAASRRRAIRVGYGKPASHRRGRNEHLHQVSASGIEYVRGNFPNG
ncbi:hypothetical protein [Streptomyces sp. NPDC056190]|uniref:hypothetical protein n=1 Tax=unclassified Streptomyces TaxID=2593676 RepID=UPI0035DE3214